MKRINCRGSHNIEYEIVLACIVSVGATFFSGDTLKNILAQTTNGIVSILGGNTNVLSGTSKGLVHAALIGDEDGKPSRTYGNRVAIVGKDGELGKDQLFQLDSNQNYEVVIDIAQLEQEGLDKNQFKVCLFLWEDNNSKPKASLDSNDMFLNTNRTYDNKTKDVGNYLDSKVKATLSEDGKTMTYSFATKENAYFGMNLVYYGGGSENEKYLKQISNNYQNYVTLQKATK